MNFSNKYIAFEGIDASGKSTQMQMFCKFLSKSGKKVLCTKEPGGVNGQIKDILLTENLNPKSRLFMFLADRAMHIQKIKKAIESEYVVSDRTLFSTIAYQAFGEGLNLDFVEKANLFATDGLLPDITFIIDIDISTMEKRKRSRDIIESKGEDFFKKVKKGYKYIATHYSNVYTIDGEKPQNAVFKEILDIWQKS